MTRHRKHGTALTLALAAGVLMGAGVMPASAAPLGDFDRQASADAQRDVQGALTQLTARHWPSALDRLERAETALLNRESLDLGAALAGDKPLPKTPAMAEIDAARAALASHDAAQARAKATLAAHDIGASCCNGPTNPEGDTCDETHQLDVRDSSSRLRDGIRRDGPDQRAVDVAYTASRDAGTKNGRA